MLLVSQNRELILNFNLMKAISIDDKTYSIAAYLDTSNMAKLGEYANIKRAQQVMVSLIEMYLNNTENNALVFYMPEN